MIPITTPEIESYLFKLASKYDEPVLKEMEEYGHANQFPIIDRLVGSLIRVLAASAKAKTVFELGSGFGYSAYWFSQAVGSEGRIICTDGDAKNKEKAKDYLTRVGFWQKIDFRVGEAVSTLQQEKGPFDIIYNDINKGDYPQAWNVAKERVRPGGLYIADNCLWFGRVAEEKVTDDIHPGWTEAIREHNDLIYADSNFEATLIPLRDGVMVARRKD